MGRIANTYILLHDGCDHLEILKVLLNGRRGEPYNISNTTNEISTLSLAELYGNLVPASAFQHIDYPNSYPAGEPQRRCPDLSKAQV